MVAFVRKNLKWLLVFTAFLIGGLVIGILSAVKPPDPLSALATHNADIYTFIEDAAYMPYFFSFVFTIVAVFGVSSFLGRFAYSQVLSMLVAVVAGYFQGGTVILVVRVYGFISIPFVVFYSILTLLIDLVVFCYLASLAKCASDKKKFGCSCPFWPTLLSCLPLLIGCFILFLLKYFFLIMCSFFL